MSTKRAVRGLLATGILLVALAPDARAQAPATARLTLVTQSTTNSLEDPVLRLRVRAENLGDDPLGELSFGVALGPAIPSRSAYDASLASGPAFQVFAETRAQDGEIAPGSARDFDLQLDLLSISGVSRTDSRMYPLRVDLRSGGQPTGAELRTPVVFLVRRPLQPLEVSWSLDLAPAPAIGPDGKLVDPSLVERISPGGDLRAEVDALVVLASGADPAPVNVAVEPRFLEELRELADGYAVEGGGNVAPGEGGAAEAASMLRALRGLAASTVVAVGAYPYSAPNLPALLRGGLAQDASQQIALGDATFLSVLGVRPDDAAVRPPAGALDQATLDQLAASGPTVLLGQDDTVSREPPADGLTLAPTALLSANVGDVPVVLLDPRIGQHHRDRKSVE